MFSKCQLISTAYREDAPLIWLPGDEIFTIPPGRGDLQNRFHINWQEPAFENGFIPGSIHVNEISSPPQTASTLA
jgi:hypothetical protein